MKSIKEKELLVNFARSIGQEADADLIEEVVVYNTIKSDVHKSIKKNIFKDLSEAYKKSGIKKEIPKLDYPVPPSLDDLMGILNETIIKEELNELVQEKTEIERTSKTVAPSHQSNSGKIDEGNETKSETAGDSGQQPSPQTLADVTAKFISESPKTSYQQPDPLIVTNDMDAIRGKLKFLEQWISKVSMAGAGGGAGSVAKLDHETKVVTTNNYSVTTKDYYIGINYAGPVTISLPTIINDGKMYIIKDESGHCSSNPITVQGTVDNDTGGFILAQDNGGIQLIYRNGWRIV
jgi:hypothetical protein